VRKWLILLLFMAMALRAHAGRRVTVGELQQFLADQYAAHKGDGSVADHLCEMELSEELTEPTLDRIIADLKPGRKTALALQLLADQSAFLEPPPSEIPNKPAPEVTEQIRLIKGAVSFASITLEKLPDFLATRTTHTFDDASIYMTPDASRTGFVGGGALHANGEYSRMITYRAGREVNLEQSTDKEEKDAAAPQGLTSFGEFGPLLLLVLSDSAKGRIVWSHWEETRTGTAAVFKYEVPQEASHYTVDFCCVLVLSQSDSEAKLNTIGKGMVRIFHATPGYQGYLYLNAETGAVLRVTLEGEMHESDPMTNLGVWLEYGSVTIGEHDYFCPMRSAALTVLHSGRQSQPGLMRLNDVTFTNYHRYGSTAHILSEPPAP
jgi:hypothetical protein